MSGRTSNVDGFCVKILITAGESEYQALQTLESASGVRVTKTKHFGTFMTNFPQIVDEPESSSTILDCCRFRLPRQFYEVCDEHWRRSLEPLTVPTVEEECPMQKLASEPGQVLLDEFNRLPLDPKMVADFIKEELRFMRKLQVKHEVPVSYLDKPGLKAIGTRWV